MLARAIFDALSLQPVIMYMDILGKENAGELKAEKQPVRLTKNAIKTTRAKILIYRISNSFRLPFKYR